MSSPTLPLAQGRDRLSDESRADFDTLIAQVATKRTARAWIYREHLRDILDRKQINVVSAMLKHAPASCAPGSSG
jgi:hypothetical protein